MSFFSWPDEQFSSGDFEAPKKRLPLSSGRRNEAWTCPSNEVTPRQTPRLPSGFCKDSYYSPLEPLLPSSPSSCRRRLTSSEFFSQKQLNRELLQVLGSSGRLEQPPLNIVYLISFLHAVIGSGVRVIEAGPFVGKVCTKTSVFQNRLSQTNAHGSAADKASEDRSEIAQVLEAHRRISARLTGVLRPLFNGCSRCEVDFGCGRGVSCIAKPHMMWRSQLRNRKSCDIFW